MGHSYGAPTALFVATRHPELVRALVLAEPPAVSLLADLHGDERERGKAMFDDTQQRMVRAMQQAYRKGDREENPNLHGLRLQRSSGLGQDVAILA
jgi:pimeloyl-ACP methyl ester carboxylesterase